MRDFKMKVFAEKLRLFADKIDRVKNYDEFTSLAEVFDADGAYCQGVGWCYDLNDIAEYLYQKGLQEDDD